MKVKQYIPALEWLPNYRSDWLKNDLFAGLTVGVMLVPQGMAYALLAGMPPIYGLYGGLIPLLVYAFLGTSRQLSIGPVAVSGLLVLAGVSQLAEPFTPHYIELVLLTSLLVGFFQLFMGVFRLGIIFNFLSQPVITGFTSAAAVIIVFSQIKYALGMDIPREMNILEKLTHLSRHLGEIHWPTLLICLGGVLLMIGLRRWNRKIPGALFVTALSILIVYIFRLDRYGVDIVQDVPVGLPHFSIPILGLESIKELIPTVLSVSIIGAVEIISIGTVLQKKHRDHTVRPNQEMFATGLSKIAGAFFQALPTSSSFTRSAVNSEAGGKTGMSSVFTAILVALTLIFLTPLFYYLPNAVLAAIVLLAVRSLFDWQEAMRLWRVHRKDFYMMLVTFLATLFIGIAEGVLTGVLLSIGVVLLKAARPHSAILGRLPDTQYFRNTLRFPQAQEEEGVIIFRFDAPLYFMNAAYFGQQMEEIIKDPGLRLVILDASSITDMDASGAEMLNTVVDNIESANINFYICGVLGPVRDLFQETGLVEKIGPKNHFLTVNEAVKAWNTVGKERDRQWKSEAIRTWKEREIQK
ncbi:SulP family inorganic anion transporter [Flavilitoribacter nigricans]|nr:solute carrier family 26 protein [Flavilitoribacter nigricans]